MPDKRALKKALERGVNPYAVAQSMVNKGRIPKSKKEEVVKAVTRETNKKKR